MRLFLLRACTQAASRGLRKINSHLDPSHCKPKWALNAVWKPNYFSTIHTRPSPRWLLHILSPQPTHSPILTLSSWSCLLVHWDIWSHWKKSSTSSQYPIYLPIRICLLSLLLCLSLLLPTLTLFTLKAMILRCGGCPMHCRMLSSICSLCPLDAHPWLPAVKTEIVSDITKCPPKWQNHL